MIAQELIEHITGTTGLDPDAAAPIRIINTAGGILVGSRQWKWTRSGEVYIPSVANANYAVLPADFGSFVGRPRVPDGVYWTFTLTTLDDINEKRTYSVEQHGNYSGAVVWRELDPTGTPPSRKRVPVLEVYPTPTEDVAQFLRAYYRIRWEDVTAGEDEIPIPRYMEPVLIQYVRAIARGWEEEDLGTADQRIAQVQKGPIYRAALVEDINTQRVIGHARGGVGDPGGVLHQFGNVGIVSGPST